ncbi:MAG: hypothetical protein HC806_00365 [Anaerolineae bacterium]|nr:hypothetical protein [Anaerolineae bacterium]
MHAWLVFLHVLAVFGFLIAHGVSATVAFALLKERDLERIKLLLEISGNSYGIMYPSLIVLFITGIISGFTGKWWGEGWIWVSIVLFIALIVAMGVLGGAIYGGARKAAGLPYADRGKPQPPVPPAPREELDAILSKGQPMLLTIIGYGGVAILAWLMMFKPF